MWVLPHAWSFSHSCVRFVFIQSPDLNHVYHTQLSVCHPISITRPTIVVTLCHVSRLVPLKKSNSPCSWHLSSDTCTVKHDFLYSNFVEIWGSLNSKYSHLDPKFVHNHLNMFDSEDLPKKMFYPGSVIYKNTVNYGWWSMIKTRDSVLLKPFIYTSVVFLLRTGTKKCL